MAGVYYRSYGAREVGVGIASKMSPRWGYDSGLVVLINHFNLY